MNFPTAASLPIESGQQKRLTGENLNLYHEKDLKHRTCVSLEMDLITGLHNDVSFFLSKRALCALIRIGRIYD